MAHVTGMHTHPCRINMQVVSINARGCREIWLCLEGGETSILKVTDRVSMDNFAMAMEGRPQTYMVINYSHACFNAWGWRWLHVIDLVYGFILEERQGVDSIASLFKALVGRISGRHLTLMVMTSYGDWGRWHSQGEMAPH